jgi:hypothetical protein
MQFGSSIAGVSAGFSAAVLVTWMSSSSASNPPGIFGVGA